MTFEDFFEFKKYIVISNLKMVNQTLHTNETSYKNEIIKMIVLNLNFLTFFVKKIIFITKKLLFNKNALNLEKFFILKKV